jgi:hypothetical protein
MLLAEQSITKSDNNDIPSANMRLRALAAMPKASKDEWELFFGISLQNHHQCEAPDCPILTHILFYNFMKVRTVHGRSTKRALDFGRRQLERKQQYMEHRIMSGTAERPPSAGISTQAAESAYSSTLRERNVQISSSLRKRWE